MPPLTPVVESLDKVPEAARTFYVQREGKFHLDLDSAPAGFSPTSEVTAANAKVIEFRDNNIALSKKVSELEPLKTKFDGIDPDEAKAAIAKTKELEKKGVKNPDDIATIVAGIVKPLQEQINAANATAAADRKRADESTLRTQVGEKFLKVGGKAKAIDYVLSQAASVFEVREGSVKAQANKYSALKPGEPLDLDEWLASMAKDHDYAFEPSKGSGSIGGGNGGGTGLKPGQTLLKNPTPQQLGEHADEIRKGTMKVDFTQ